MQKWTQLYFMRHGQSDWNAENRIQGRTERPLNEIGRSQAKEIGAYFSNIPLAKIYSSTMLRAKETAEIIASYQNCEVVMEPYLQESAYGEAEGMTRDEYRQRYAEQLKIYEKMPLLERLKNHVVPNAETSWDTAHRVIPVLNKIALLHPAQQVLVVSHGFLIRSVLSVIAGIDDKDLHVDNTGFVILEGDGQQWRIKDNRLMMSGISI